MKITFADKVAGASGPQGLLSDDDINEIKLAVNTNADSSVGAVEPYTNLAGNTWNLSADGRHKTKTISADTTLTVTISDGDEGYLMVTGAGNDVTISGTTVTTHASGSTFISVVNVAGQIVVIGYDVPAPVITPNPPTNFVVDDTAKTAGVTFNPDFLNLTDYDFTQNGGTTVSTPNANPMTVTPPKAIGQVGFRVKSAPGRNASAWLFNEDAYTSSGTTVIPKRYNARSNVVETETNSDIWRGTGNNSTDQFASDTLNPIANGTNFLYVHDITGPDEEYAFPSLNDSSTNGPMKDGSGGALHNYYVGYASLYGKINFGGRSTADQTANITLNPGDVLGLLVMNGVVQAVYSKDNESTWQVAGTITGGLFPPGPMYASMGITGSNALNPNRQVNHPRLILL